MDWIQKRKARNRRRLDRAHEIRKFEIELYWKRSAYFWAFIALAFTGYGALQLQDQPCSSKSKTLGFLLANIGFIASAAWFHVNRGSKFWQENWEAQVDRLEDRVTGPLYKEIIVRETDYCFLEGCKRRAERFKQWLTGAGRRCCGNDPKVASVSKINQLGSLYVAIVWIFVGAREFPYPIIYISDEFYSLMFLVITLLAVIAFSCFGKSTLGGPERHHRIVRTIER